jgi:hypothetical protein
MMNKLLVGALALFAAQAFAKIPAPVLTDEQKLKALETAQKTAWQGKVDAYLLCKAQDKVAAQYMKTAKTAGREAQAPVATPPCADPGKFAFAPPEAAKPIEQAGAHSPPATAASPPSGKKSDAEIKGPAKKS